VLCVYVQDVGRRLDEELRNTERLRQQREQDEKRIEDLEYRCVPATLHTGLSPQSESHNVRLMSLRSVQVALSSQTINSQPASQPRQSITQ
jgi:hypothetical protein